MRSSEYCSDDSCPGSQILPKFGRKASIEISDEEEHLNHTFYIKMTHHILRLALLLFPWCSAAYGAECGIPAIERSHATLVIYRPHNQYLSGVNRSVHFMASSLED